MTIAFFLTSLIVAASPGTGVLLTLAAALGRGARAGIVAAFGCTLGIVPHLLAALTGVAAALHTGAVAFQGLKAAGVLYLLWMAWRTLQEQGPLTVAAAGAPRSAWRVIGSAILANLLNPKLSIFFVAFLPQFIAAGDPAPVRTMAWLGLAFMGVTFAVFAVYAVAAAQVRARILSHPPVLRWMRRVFAAAFVGLGAKLALTDR